MKLKVLSVSEVNNYIKKTLDNDFILNNLSVKGEISNLKYHLSGHIYFSLKDINGKINCVMFKNRVYELDFKLEDGMEVIVSGRASVYTANGTFQIYCEEIQKEGLGELHIKFEKLKAELSKEGYFNSEFKKPIPENPMRVGIVTSATGAAIMDIKNVVRRRNKIIDLVLYPAQVQGIGAYKTIIQGIKYFNKKNNVDVIIIGRGGGSIEELWNFNEKQLAIEIFKSTIPIISAVGHEVDFTISDFVSDLRAATPSQAAEIVAPVENEIYESLHQYKVKINNSIASKINLEKVKLQNYKKILDLKSPINVILNGYQEIDKYKKRFDALLCGKIKIEKAKVISLNNILQAHNPINILGKGYAIIEGEGSKLLKNKDDFNEFELLKIKLRDGYVKGNFALLEKGEDL